MLVKMLVIDYLIWASFKLNLNVDCNSQFLAKKNSYMLHTRSFKVNTVPLVLNVSCCTCVLYLHHEDDSVEGDHDQHCVLKRGRCHKVPQSVLKSLSVLGHVACHRLGTDGEVDASPLRDTNLTKQSWRLSSFTWTHVNVCVCVLVCPTPRFSPDCTPESSCHPAPGRWWWSEPRRCWQRRTETRRSRPHRKWTFPSDCPDLAPCSPLSHPSSAAGP